MNRNGRGQVQGDLSGQAGLERRRFPTFKYLRWAVVTRLRLQTPVVAIRLDLAYKVNPSGHDLHRPGDEVLFNMGLVDSVPERAWRRLNFHLSIQRAF